MTSLWLCNIDFYVYLYKILTSWILIPFHMSSWSMMVLLTIINAILYVFLPDIWILTQSSYYLPWYIFSSLNMNYLITNIKFFFFFSNLYIYPHFVFFLDLYFPWLNPHIVFHDMYVPQLIINYLLTNINIYFLIQISIFIPFFLDIYSPHTYSLTQYRYVSKSSQYFPS